MKFAVELQLRRTRRQQGLSGRVKRTHEGWDGRDVEETRCFKPTEGDKMVRVQESEVLAGKSDTLRWITEVLWQEEADSYRLSSHLHMNARRLSMCACTGCVHTYMCIQM